MTLRTRKPEVIVIGAGMGGLVCAARLAKAGVSTLLLEQDRRVGGTAGGFSRSGFSFPTGPVGVTGPDFINSALHDCGVRNLPIWTRSHFRLITEGLNVVLSRPLPELATELASLFPQESGGILEISQDLAASIGALRATEPARLPMRSAETHVRKFLKDERLVRLFASQGAEPPSASWPVMVRMWDFLSETGIWYPSCGIAGLPELFRGAFQEHGGELLMGTPVRRILVEKGRVSGVLLEGGLEIHSRVVISNADYMSTMEHLLPQGVLPATFHDAVARKHLSGTVLSVSLGLRSPVSPEAGWTEPNLLYCRKLPGPHDAWFEKGFQRPSFESDEVWIHRPSLHDPSLAPDGKEVVVLRVNASYSSFEPFRRGKGRHAEPYYQLKETLGQALVNRAADLMPGLPEQVEYMDVATPLTFEFWGHRTRGSVAGWAWTDMAVEDYTIPPVDGLLLTGICSYSHLFRGGMGTAIHSGLETAARILSSPGS